jgi:hypothetical protein
MKRILNLYKGDTLNSEHSKSSFIQQLIYRQGRSVSLASSSQPSVVSQLVEAYARRERLAGWSWLTMHFI